MNAENAIATTDELLDRVASDRSAIGELLQRHRDRAKRLVALRMDAQLANRIDPSDVVQEAFAEASVKVIPYARNRPVAFYPWLRQIVWQKLVDHHRRHVLAEKRSVRKEVPLNLGLSSKSANLLARAVCGRVGDPGSELVRKENRSQVRQALDQLRDGDREVLVLVYLEQLSISEAAAVMGVSAKAVGMRHLRALERLRKTLHTDAKPE